MPMPQEPQATIRNCVIENNAGNGIASVDGLIDHCTIRNNVAVSGAGLSGCHGTIRNCTIIDNTATDLAGGGLRSCTGSLENCLIAGNSASGEGGGICDCGSVIRGCTIVDNTSDYQGGGLYCSDGQEHALQNCIVRGNSADYGGNEIYLDGAPTHMSITYCDILDGSSGIETHWGATYTWGSGNVDVDPGFADAASGGYHLEANSPCVNAGDPAFVAGEDETDIDGQSRVQWDRVDIGADESDTQPLVTQFQVTSASGSEATRQAYLTITLDRASTEEVSVQYTLGGTATSSTDYCVGTNGIKALKRNTTLTHTDPTGTGNADTSVLDTRFQALGDADVLTTTVEDCQLVPSTWAGFGWRNYGATTSLDGGSGQEWGLFRFDFSALGSNLLIHKAEMRLYYTNGNIGTTIYRILTTWSEGIKDGNYPGLTPMTCVGASWYHPNGINYDQNQLADGSPGTTGSWATGTFSASDYDTAVSRKAANNRWGTWDMTSLLQGWADGTANNGVALNNANYSYRLSECSTAEQPVLFVDYTAQVAQLVTFAPGETSKTIPLSIINDTQHESSETIEVTLSSATGAILGDSRIATYTIIDND